MSLKILGGECRGFSVSAPKALTTRPTSILVRRKLFDWRQHLDDFSFIDLCAGSGVVGFEAWSRGASKVFLNEPLKGAFASLVANKEKLQKAFPHQSNVMTLSNLDARIWVQRELVREFPETQSSILYLDPPYEQHGLYFEILELLKTRNYAGEIWIESDRLKGVGVKELTGVLCSVIKVVEQGDHFVVVGKIV